MVEPASLADFMPATDPRPTLIGLTREELAAEIARLGEPNFRAGQLWHWIYHRGSKTFAEMSSLSKSFRANLEENYSLARPAPARDLVSEDGTRKWLLRFADGQEAEAVLIPEDDRGALCISSQVGCTLTCSFCHTGTQKLVRNLTSAEIVGQIMLARDAVGEWPSSAHDRAITNIVLMGMGEPLYNFEHVAAAMRVATDNEGIAISRRRITLSTAGVVPMLERCAREIGVNLAISLHAVTDEVRDLLVPLNRRYPIAELLAACRRYAEIQKSRRITFEYIMIDGVNDSEAEARELVRLLHGIPAKVNMIPFNPWPGSNYATSSNTRIARFQKVLNDACMTAVVRTPRGRDIMAACGQLKSASVKLRASERRAV